jgi:acyl CoA:acetate/3-ketoacid CoA transferase
MAVGLSDTNFSHKVLNHMLRGVSAAPPPGSNNVGLHTADPGAAGTTSPTTGTVGGTRVAVTFNAAAAAACTSSNTPSWAVWDGGSVTISHISVWDATTAGNFLYSAVLTTAKAITAGDTFTLSSLSVSLAPRAA